MCSILLKAWYTLLSLIGIVSSRVIKEHCGAICKFLGVILNYCSPFSLADSSAVEQRVLSQQIGPHKI